MSQNGAEIAALARSSAKDGASATNFGDQQAPDVGGIDPAPLEANVPRLRVTRGNDGHGYVSRNPPSTVITLPVM